MPCMYHAHDQMIACMTPTGLASVPVLGLLNGWSATLTEPLMPLRRRAAAEDGLARAHVANKDVVALFLAGLASDLAQTLPDRDVWRKLSARVGSETVGANPPETDGASTPDGKRFGTWRDATDLTPLIFASPFDDPGLYALAGDDRGPHAAAILAAAGYGWRPCVAMIEAVHQAPVPQREGSPVVDMDTKRLWDRGAQLHQAREACVKAVRWLTHRRRAYVGPADVWPGESAFRWAWRAVRTDRGQSWADTDVTNGIAAQKVNQLAPQDRPKDDELDDF